jgi:hypothetical protein
MIEQLFKDMVNAMNDNVIEIISRIVWGQSYNHTIEQLFKDMINAMNDDVIEIISRIVWGWSYWNIPKNSPIYQFLKNFSSSKLKTHFDYHDEEVQLTLSKYARNVSIMDFTWLYNARILTLLWDHHARIAYTKHIKLWTTLLTSTHNP